MITAERKPIEEIRAMIAPYKRVLVLGCGSCVAECAAGGEKETGMLASTLRMANKMDGKEVIIHEKTLDRQCVKDFVILLDDVIGQYDAVLSLGCGAGVQAVAEMFSEIPILPALNTGFLGETRDQGLWVENCLGCGDCMLARFRRGVPPGAMLQTASERPLRRIQGREMRNQSGCPLRVASHHRQARPIRVPGPAGADLPSEGLVEKTGRGAEKDHEGGSAEVKDVSRLKRVLDQGGFAVTAECGPPKGADPEAILKKAEHLRNRWMRSMSRTTRPPSCACPAWPRAPS